MPQSVDPPAAGVPPRRILHCAGIRLWAGSDERQQQLAEAVRALQRRPGIRALSKDLFVVAPVPGDPAVFDAAVEWSQELLEQSQTVSPEAEAAAGLRALVFPTVVTFSARGAELVNDSLTDDLERQLPKLPGAGVYLTTRASKVLEYPRRLLVGGSYQGPSGTMIPLVLAGEARLDAPPWRNPELMGRATRSIARPGLSDHLTALLEEPVSLIAGPVGCGKSRLVWEQLIARQETLLWLRARHRRAPAPRLGQQMMRLLFAPSSPQAAAIDDDLRAELREQLDSWRRRESLAEPEVMAAILQLAIDRRFSSEGTPLILVCDDLHQVDPEDARFLELVRTSPHLGEKFRLVLIGRSGGRWRSSLDDTPALDLPELAEGEMDQLAKRLVEGLSLPEPMQRRFLEAARGNPFAFEEGLIALIHERGMRRIHGSFFFGGDGTADFHCSNRLVRHLEAELARIAPLLPVRILAVADGPVPSAELASASTLLGVAPEKDWDARIIEAGLARPADSPWGDGLEFTNPAFRRALSQPFPDDEQRRVRNCLGELLAAVSHDGRAHWEAWKLLRGGDNAIEPLFMAMDSSYAPKIPREDLLDALAGELESVQQRGGATETELQLLWRLLPLARRMGKLHNFTENLARGVELATAQPSRLLALASIKAEMDQEAGRYKEAETTIQQALKAAAGSDQRRQALLLVQLGRLFIRQGRYAEAGALFENLRNAVKTSGAGALGATCEFFLGNIALQEGRVMEAYDHHKRSLEERHRQKLLRPVGSSLSAMGAVSIAVGNYPKALDYYRQAGKVLEQHGKEGEESFALLGLARALTRLGDFTGASQPARRALALRQGRDDVAGEAIARLAVAGNYLNLGKLDDALSNAREAHFQLSMVSLDHHLADAEELLGRIYFGRRQFEEARDHTLRALDLHDKHHDRRARGFDHAWLLEISLALEDADGIHRSAAELRTLLRDLPNPDLGEILNFRLYRGLDWLKAQGHKVSDPLAYLQRAYQLVLDKASHLKPEDRHQFLFQIPDNESIVNAATRHNLAAGA